MRVSQPLAHSIGMSAPAAPVRFGDRRLEPALFHMPDKATDGRFSWDVALKNFGKGLISPIANIFRTKKTFFTTLAVLAAGAALLIATGGAIAPALLTLGIVMSGVQSAKGIYRLVTAENGDKRELAFLDIGAGAGGLALTMVGARSSLKGYGMAPEQFKRMSLLEATIENVDLSRYSLWRSMDMLRQGKAWDNLYNGLRSLVNPLVLLKRRNGVTEPPPKTPRELHIEAKKQELRPIADEAAKLFEKQYAEAAAQVDDILGRYGRIDGRPKTAVSVLDKLARKAVDKKRVYRTLDDVLPDVGDAVGTRLILPRGNVAEVSQLVNALAKAVREGRLVITEINNYRGAKGHPYFTDAHINLLMEAADIARARGFSSENLVVVHVGEKASKVSGYTTAQVNVIYRNGARGELQIRGPEINRFAEVEHIVYDMRQGKTLPGNLPGALKNQFRVLFDLIRQLPGDLYNVYLNHISEAYNRYRMLEKGLGAIQEPVLPDGLKNLPELNLAYVEGLYRQVLGFRNLQDVLPTVMAQLGNLRTLSMPLQKLHAETGNHRQHSAFMGISGQ